MPPKKAALHVAFINFRATFDSIDRKILWNKLAELGIESKLLALLMELHHNTVAKVRINNQGSQTSQIDLHKWVRQGCMLAPLLFNLYINDLPAKLEDPAFHPPKIGTLPLTSLLYADDLIIFSQTKIGLKRALWKLLDYSHLNALNISTEKSKIITFNKPPPKLNNYWKIGEHRFEQVKEYRYLGITFSYRVTWIPHIKQQNTTALIRLASLNKLIYSHSPMTVTPAIKVFSAKISPILTYGAEIWGPMQPHLSEVVQNKFLRLLLGVPQCTQIATMRAEVAIYPIECEIQTKALYYYSKVKEMPHTRLPKKCLEEQVHLSNTWLSRISALRQKLGLLACPHDSIVTDNKKAIRQRLRDVHAQQEIALLKLSKAHSWLAKEDKIFKREKYFEYKSTPSVRSLFTKARMNMLDLETRLGRYKGVPYQDRLCLCGSNEVEDLIHFFLKCPIYAQIRISLLDPLLKSPPWTTESNRLAILLRGKSFHIYTQVTKYIKKALQLKATYLIENAVDCNLDGIHYT